MPFDQFTIEQLAGDLLPERDARPADRLRLQPLQHHDQRRRRDRRGVPRALHPRPHRDDVAGLAGPDGRLRRLPRPQVRPAHAAASSTRWRRSSTTRRRRRWTATSRTRRRSCTVPLAGRSAAVGRAREAGARREAAARRAPQAGARPEFDTWLADGEAGGRRRRRFRRRTCSCTRRSTTATATVALRRRRPARAKRRCRRRSSGGRAQLGAKAAYLNQGAMLEVAGRRRLRSRPAVLRTPPGSSCRRTIGSGAILARMDDDARLPRLGPVGRGRPHRRAHHPQVARRTRSRSSRKTQLPAEPVDARRRHLRRLAARRPACKVYVNGAAAADERRRPTRSTSTIRTTVPLQARPAAHERRRCRGVADPGRAPLRPRARRRARSASLANADAVAALLAKPADKRTAAEIERAVRLVADDRRRRRSRSSAQAGDARRASRATSRPAARSPTSCRRRPRRRWRSS